MDLNDWLRGESDWRDLWEFLDRLRARSGSAYQAALLEDPDIAARLAEKDPDKQATVPVEGFGAIDARLASLEDRLIQLVYVVARNDPSTAPTAPRPDFLHIRIREQARRDALRDMESQLIPGGESG